MQDKHSKVVSPAGDSGTRLIVTESQCVVGKFGISGETRFVWYAYDLENNFVGSGDLVDSAYEEYALIWASMFLAASSVIIKELH